jgi:hypothetical protein
MCSKHLLEVWEATFKYDEKGRKQGEKAGESDGKKEGQYTFIRSSQGYICKDGKGEKSDGKKDGQ